ncbi:MAG: preprotein translocase subunit SecG [Alphaproteobacteria bacterium]|nr:preprotein translocase subunit SecG [Alphaproteobacteria bacterium]
MFGFLLAVHIVVTILLLLIILIQKSEGGSSLFSSGSGTSMFNARGTSNMLTKATWGLATIFLANCILMAHISANRVKASSTIITGTPHASKQLSNKAINDLNANKDQEVKLTDNKNSSKKDTKKVENKSETKNNNKTVTKEKRTIEDESNKTTENIDESTNKSSIIENNNTEEANNTKSGKE